MSIVRLHANLSYFCLFIIFFNFIYLTSIVLANTKAKICGDPKCTKVLSQAKTLGGMQSHEIGHLSFKRGQEVRVMGKTLRESQELWDVFLDGKRGYIPKSFLRETDVFIRNPKDVVAFEMKRLDEIPDNAVRPPPHMTGQQPSSAGQQAAGQQQVPTQASIPIDEQTLQPPSAPASKHPAATDEGTDLTEDEGDTDEDADYDDEEDDDDDDDDDDDTEMDEGEEEDDTEILDNPDFDVDADESEEVDSLHEPQQQQQPQEIPVVVAPVAVDTPVDSSLADTPSTRRQPEGVPHQGDDTVPEEQNKEGPHASDEEQMDYQKIRDKATSESLDHLRESLQKRRGPVQSMDMQKELEDLNALLASKQTDGAPLKETSTDEQSVMNTVSATRQQPEILSVTDTVQDKTVPHAQPEVPATANLVDKTESKVVEGQPELIEGEKQLVEDQKDLKEHQEEVVKGEPEQPTDIRSRIKGAFHSVMSTVLGGEDVATDKPPTTPDKQVNNDDNLQFEKNERLDEVTKEKVIVPLVHDMDRHKMVDMYEKSSESPEQELYADITAGIDKADVETVDENIAEQLPHHQQDQLIKASPSSLVRKVHETVSDADTHHVSVDSGGYQHAPKVEKVLDSPSSLSIDPEETGDSKDPIGAGFYVPSVDIKLPTDGHFSDTSDHHDAAESMQLEEPVVDIPGSPESQINQHDPDELYAAASVNMPPSDIPSRHGADIGRQEDPAESVAIEPTPSIQQSGIQDQQHQTKLVSEEYLSFDDARVTKERYTIIEGTRFPLDDEDDMVYVSESIVASSPVFADPVTMTRGLSEQKDEELKVNLFKNAAVDAQLKEQHRNVDGVSQDFPSQSQNITPNINEPKVDSVEVELPDLTLDKVYATADFMSRKPLSHETTSTMYETEDGVAGNEERANNEDRSDEEHIGSNEPANDDKFEEFLAGSEENAVEDNTGFFFNDPSAPDGHEDIPEAGEVSTDGVIDDEGKQSDDVEETEERQDDNQEPDKDDVPARPNDEQEDKTTDHIAHQNDALENDKELSDNDDSQTDQKSNEHIEREPQEESNESDQVLLDQTTESVQYEQVEPASSEQVPTTPSYADTITHPPVDTQEEGDVTKDVNNNDGNDPYMTDSDWSQKITDSEAEEKLYQSTAHKMVKDSMGTMASGMNWILTKLPLSIQSFLEHEPMGLSPQMALMAAMTTFATVVITALCSCMCHSKEPTKMKKKDPSSVIRGLEEKLFIATKEKETLEDALSSTEKKLSMMDTQLITMKKSSGSQKADLQTNQIHTESLNKTLTSLQEEVDELKGGVYQRDMMAQQQTEQMSSLQTSLANSQLMVTTLEAKYQQSCYEVSEQQGSVDQMYSQTEALNEHVQHLEARKLQLSVEADEWERRVNDLNETLSQLREEYKKMEETVTFKENELQLLRDCFVQLKTFEDEEQVEEVQNDDDDDDDEESRTETVVNTRSVQEKLKTMMDVSVVNAALKGAEEERDSLANKLQIEAEARKEMEDQIEALKKESDSAQLAQTRSERQCQDATTRLNVLSSYFKEKEVELQKELGEQEVMKKQNATMLLTADEETKLMHEELTSLREQVSSMRNEISLSEKDYRGQIAVNEKKAHENWLAARKSDREAKEARHEASVLRQKLMDLERRQTSGLLRPLPTRLPPPGMPNGVPPPPIPYDPPHLPIPGDRSPSRGSMLGYRDDDPRGSPPSGMRPPPMRMPPPPLGPSPPPFDRRFPPPRDLRSPPRDLRSPPRDLRSPPRNLRSPPRDYPDMPSPPHLDRRPLPPPHLLDHRSPPPYQPPPYHPPPPPHGFLRGPLPPPHLMRRDRGDPTSPLDVRESDRLGDPRTSSPYDPPQHRDRPPPPRQPQSHV